MTAKAIPATLAAALWLCLALACTRTSDSSQPQPATQPEPANSMPPTPTRAQPKLKTMKLWVGPEELIAELAVTGLQLQTGMMFRTNIAENEAMLFIFGAPHQAGFWMKNTIVPLSAAYVDPDGVILELHDLKPHDTNVVLASSSRVQYVLETAQGWFKRHNIGPGAVIRTEMGNLHQTFFK